MGLFSSDTVIPVLRFTGAIGMATPLRPGLSLEALAGPIEKAFSFKKSPAVALIINSPGGSPVQSRLIYKRVRALAEEKSKKVFAFTEDVAASGGYMLALAGDEIYADPSSIVGSIGVISAGFGFDKAIARYGVERRVYTAGEHKMSLDPFQPEKPDEIERLKSLQRDVHATFIEMVKARRGAKLSTKEELFTGSIWSGAQARDLGLIDGLGDVRSKMRELYGDKVRLRVVSKGGGWLRRRLGMSHAGGAVLDALAGHGKGAGSSLALQTSLADEVISAIEARALWARFGL